MDTRRTILWAVFSIAGLLLYNNWLAYEGKTPLFGPQNTSKPESVAVEGEKKNDVPVATTSASNNLPVIAPKTIPASMAQLANKERFKLQNDVLEIEVSADGANVVSATLLKELDADKKPMRLMQLSAGHQYFARSGLIAAGNAELPNHTSEFKLQSTGKDGSGRPYLVVISERNGVSLEKTFILNPSSYVIDVMHRVTKNNAAIGPLVLYTELVRDGSKLEESQFYSTFTGPAVYTDKEKFNKLEFADIEKNKINIPKLVAAGDPAWVAMVQHYYASAWIPSDKVNRDVYAGKIDTNVYRVGIQTPLDNIAPGTTTTETARLFVGPQQESVLEAIAPGLELLKDYGYLTILAKPIFWTLERIHEYVNNWGWSIVILTFLIKLLFYPLSAASYKSMARMKEVQPRVMAMREANKGNPQKMNQEMMALYKKEKINPLGGCLPMLIQIPVFISLYWVLLSSVEIRNAPWILWIHDLAVPDPYYILPVIMAASMWVQTKLNPTPPDPIQAKVMLYMPIIFSIMFFFFPAGLVLYWVVNNILSIAQQWQINKMIIKRAM
jgi:YidC/Oxa1 family membrane protein insertase